MKEKLIELECKDCCFRFFVKQKELKEFKLKIVGLCCPACQYKLKEKEEDEG